jgi:hypothetical protein
VDEKSSMSGVDVANLSVHDSHCEKTLTSEAKLNRFMNIEGRDEMFAEIDGTKIYGKKLKTLEYPKTDNS